MPKEEKEHQCLQCQQKFPHASKLRRHMETHMITGDYLCGLCDCLCNRLSALDDHWRKACPEFRLVFGEDEIKKMSHEDLREAAFRLTIDRYSIEEYIQEPGPSRENKKSMSSVCIYCNLHLPDSTLTNHYGVHSNRNSPGDLCLNSVVRYICDLCGYGFRYKKSLFTHWRQKCAEVSANCPEEGIVLDNRQLKKMVQDLVKRAEVEKPYEILYHRREEEVDEEDEDEETKLSFTSRITPIDGVEHQNWNVENISDHPKCSDCNRIFHSSGRLKRHAEVFHEDEKNRVPCELCQMKFSQKRILLRHLRSSCKSMRVEEPDEKKRLKMSTIELNEMIEKVKPRWKKLFNMKKAENLKFITAFLNDIQKNNPMRLDNNIILEAPIPISDYLLEASSDDHTCEFCKINFDSQRVLYQHQQLAHSNQLQPAPRQQLTITASSLLPYFKLPEALFYDEEGCEYRMGKLLDRGKAFAKHLKDRLVTPGTIVENIKNGDSFVVELTGGNGQHVLLNEHEFTKVCNEIGELKTLCSRNPRILDDIPKLEKFF